MSHRVSVINRRVCVSAALALGGAVGALLSHSVPAVRAQASAPAAPAAQGVQAQLDRMQAQIAALQAEVKRLRAQRPQGATAGTPAPPNAYKPYLRLYPAPGDKALKAPAIPPGVLTAPPASAYTPYQYITPSQPAAPAPQRRFTNIPPTRIIPLGEATGEAATLPNR